MKKINSTKLMAVLAALCLVTSSFVGSTLAKYITTANSNDAARVAKFGVVLQADGNLFDQTYINEIELSDDAAELAVQSSTVDEVVAPGTENAKGMAFSVNGTPEVSTRLDATIVTENIYLKAGTYAVMVKAPTVTADSFKADTYYTKSAAGEYELAASWADATDYFTKTNEVTVAADYYPVVFKAGKTGTVADDTLNDIAADYVAKLGGNGQTGAYSITLADAETLVGGKTTYKLATEFDPNFEYSSLEVSDEKLTWAWEFDYAGAGTYDKEDTILGDLMAGTLTDAEVVKVDSVIKAPVAADAADDDIGDYNLQTEFSIDVTVTQLDDIANEANK